MLFFSDSSRINQSVEFQLSNTAANRSKGRWEICLNASTPWDRKNDSRV